MTLLLFFSQAAGAPGQAAEPEPAASLPTWGGLTLPQVDAEGGIATQRLVFGARERTAAGALRVDYIATKHLITLKWSGLTAAERTLVLDALTSNRLTPAALTLPDGRSYANVLAREDSLQDDLAGYTGATPLYDLALTCEES